MQFRALYLNILRSGKILQFRALYLNTLRTRKILQFRALYLNIFRSGKTLQFRALYLNILRTRKILQFRALYLNILKTRKILQFRKNIETKIPAQEIKSQDVPDLRISSARNKSPSAVKEDAQRCIPCMQPMLDITQTRQLEFTRANDTDCGAEEWTREERTTANNNFLR